MLSHVNVMIQKISAIPSLFAKGLATCRKFGFIPVLRHAFGRIRRNGFHATLNEVHNGPIAEKPLSNRHDYAEWIQRYDTRSNSEREKLRSQGDILPTKPIVSLVVTTDGGWTSENLVEAIAAIRQQVYPFWELLIVDTTSKTSALRTLIKKTASQDKRIKRLVQKTPANVCTAMNLAIDFATGDWVLFLKPDLLLAEHALFYVVKAALLNANAAFIYSDTDRIDTQGKRYSPSFKPDWDEAMFYSRQLLLPLCVYRKALLKELGSLRTTFDPVGEFDLILRCLEQAKREEIRHVPRILCHQKDLPISIKSSTLQLLAELTAGRDALCEHFMRTKADCTVDILDSGYRLRYRLPNPPPRVSIIIPARNGQALLGLCIESVLSKSTYPDFELLIIDNGSDESAMLDYLLELEKNPRIRIIRDPRPFNYSALNNLGAAAATGDILALLNSDIEVISPDWLEEMVALASLPETGAVGACLWYPTDTLQHGGVVLGIKGVAAHAPRCLSRTSIKNLKHVFCLRSVSAVTGACLVVKRERYEEVGGLNQDALAVAFNDIDFCLRLRQKGYQNLWTSYAELYHHESASRGAEDTAEKRKRFAGEIAYMQEHWRTVLTNDPAYNPNLTLDGEDFTMAWPPRTTP